MVATLYNLPPAGPTLDWPDLARRAAPQLQAWLDLVNPRYPLQPITVLKEPAQDSAWCGWTLRLENKYSPMVAQMLAGGPLCPVVDRQNRFDVWFGRAADYDPLDTSRGVHGVVYTTVTTDSGGSIASITSNTTGLNNKLSPTAGPNPPHLEDYFIFSGEIAGQEYFGMSMVSSGGFQNNLLFLITREITEGQWLVMSYLQNGCTMMTGRAIAPGFRQLIRLTTQWLWQPVLTNHFGWPVLVNSTTYAHQSGPVSLEAPLILPSEFLARARSAPLWTAQVEGLPVGQFCVTVGGNLAVLIPPP
ncbi:hypothetical protein KBZ18_11135 [Synechococcus sp. Cruz-9H2]|uniref:hypothetical protein n=1 Tax=unclassified Synechococcus TaxID=2626047 RepID=UPI0020CF762B|nr:MULTISPECIES: hypothetical protein [unclassified Synechococcus]MCP9820043.1 hypothetical protein [Synechococcus sp. Cruz-9H2]MCP9844349.1 hypothetical protein [Synechococcus sp. Edmonson 11F2]MCP9856473.1 hypothetical protein [Synechococcus sp. Cruz-9C9]MCP9863752.1 hypothetical protein [Synechococcus sp. Cruz-7E5]MCP9870953.1 hypothetical protein [Synechococcus sp. Cruz-7B9]